MTLSKAVTFLLLGATALLAACGPSGHVDTKMIVTESYGYRYGGYNDRFAYEFALKDGTICVATNHGGVTCGWR